MEESCFICFGQLNYDRDDDTYTVSEPCGRYQNQSPIIIDGVGQLFINKTVTEMDKTNQTVLLSRQSVSKRHLAYREELLSMNERYFRCGFKNVFLGALKRVFSGMFAVTALEVSLMRQYQNTTLDFDFCYSKQCFIAEFSLQSKSTNIPYESYYMY